MKFGINRFSHCIRTSCCERLASCRANESNVYDGINSNQGTVYVGDNNIPMKTHWSVDGWADFPDSSQIVIVPLGPGC